MLAQDTVQDTSGHSTLAAVVHPYDVRSGPALEPRAPRDEAVAADRRLTHALRKKSSNLTCCSYQVGSVAYGPRKYPCLSC